MDERTVLEVSLKSVIAVCFDRPDDQQALTELNRLLRPLVLASLARLAGDHPHLAEDAYQSAFVKYLSMFYEGSRVGIDYEAYFLAIAKNCLLDEFRTLGRTMQFDKEFAYELSALAAVSIPASEARVELLQAFGLLGQRCQFVLESYYIRGLPSEELARRLNIGHSSVHMAIKRCRDELKRILENMC